MTIAQWNVETLLDREAADRPERRTALVAMELSKCNIDIAAVFETRFSEYGCPNDLGYSFFSSGKPVGERREAGVGFAIKKDIVAKLIVSHIIMTTGLPLSKDNLATIISVYAPTTTNPDENTEIFYNQLASGVFSGIPRTDKLLLTGYFNAWIGRDNDKWPLARANLALRNAIPMASFYWLCALIVTNSMFRQKDERMISCMHPRSRHWHMIDFVITS